MNNQFKKPTLVAHPDTKELITVNPNKSEYGSIRLDQVVNNFSNGYFQPQKRTAFIGGKVEDLESLGLKEGEVFTGKIIRLETWKPQYEGHQPKINPQTMEEVLTNGVNTFFQHIYSEDPNALDQILVEPMPTMETTEAAASTTGVTPGTPEGAF